MKILSLGLVGVLGGLSVIASSMTAQALDFSFSFSTQILNSTTSPGTVTGVIQGLNEGLNNQFTIKVNSNSVGIAPGTIFDRNRGGSFQVTDGNITSVSNNIYAETVAGLRERIFMNYYFDGNYFNELSNSPEFTTYSAYDFKSSPFTVDAYNFSPVGATAVPFDFNPTEGAALGIPLFVGLGMLRKKKLAQKSAQKKVAELVS